MRRTLIASSILALVIASIVLGHVPDDWSTFDHKTFQMTAVESGDRIQIAYSDGRMDTVKLLGISPIDASASDWLKACVLHQQITLLLQSPQTRDSTGALRAFVFLNNRNLSFELAKAGLAYADRRENTELDGLIDSAEAEARKKKRGAWPNLRIEQMPAWRQAWLKSLPKSR